MIVINSHNKIGKKKSDYWGVGSIYALTDPEFVGRIPVRQEIEVLPADEPRLYPFSNNEVVITSKNKVTRKSRIKYLGFTIKETIGVGIINSKAILKLAKETGSNIIEKIVGKIDE